MDILKGLLHKYSQKDIANSINVSLGTVKRWIALDNIPKSYTFELMKLANIPIDYTKFNYKDKDQFFTPTKTANYCYSKIVEILENNKEDLCDYMFIEPSAGNGNFLKILPVEQRIGLDIESECSEILIHDYLSWTPDVDKKYIVIGNPPFGLRGQLALKFLNHSSKFAEYVCFILPQLFESDGKGSPRKRVKNLNLVLSERISPEFTLPEGGDIKVECIYQIWSKNHREDALDIKKVNNKNIRVYSLSDGKTPSSTRNKKMIGKCDIYIPSTCFGKENMKHYPTFESLPGQKGYGIVFNVDKEESIKKFISIEWNTVAFLSTNSAYNIRTSQIINRFSQV
jgi:hypothetical protein